MTQVKTELYLDTADPALNLMHEAALREDELRAHGATAERIKSDYNSEENRFGARLARIAMGGKAVAHVLPQRPEVFVIPRVPSNSGLTEWARRTDQLNRSIAEEDEPVDLRSRAFKD